MGSQPGLVNATDETRVLFAYDRGRVDDRRLSRDLQGEPLEVALPMRRFAAWPRKRNYEGRFWSATAGGHLPFESLFERDVLRLFDLDPNVVGLSTQPVLFLWARGARDRGHVPDVFLRRRDFTGVVVDVRPAERIDERARRQFMATAAACEVAGWDYQVVDALPEAVRRNVGLLCGFRHVRYSPTSELADVIVGVFADGAPFDEGRCEASRRAGVDVGADVVLHLLAVGALRCDLAVALSGSSVLTADLGWLR